MSVLAVFYLSNVFVYSDGAWGLFERFRSNETIKNIGLLECIICVSFWVALVISLLVFDNSWLLYAFGISGATILIDRLTEL